MSRDFGWALEQIRNGERVARSAWITVRRASYIGLQKPDANSRMNKPFIYVCSNKGDMVPWVPDQMDLLGRDWELYALAQRDARARQGGAGVAAKEFTDFRKFE